MRWRTSKKQMHAQRIRITVDMHSATDYHIVLYVQIVLTQLEIAAQISAHSQ